MDDMASVGLQVDSREVRTASGDLEKFAGAGDRAGGSAGRAQGAFAGMGRGLAVAAGAAAAAAIAMVSIAGAFALVGRGAADIDKVVKSARRIEATVTGFRAMEMAAGEAGVALASLTDGIQTMDREIAKGSKGAADSLKTLGLAAKDLAGLDADQKLALIANQIQAMGLTTGQASVVLQEFGIRNKEMVLAVMGGGDVFRAARADIDDYGLGLTSIQTDEIEAANDAIGRLSLIGQKLAQELSLAVTPALGEMAKAMTDSLREGGLLRGVIDGLAAVAERLTNAFSFLFDNAYNIGAVIAVLASTQIPAMVAASYAAITGLSLMSGAMTLATIAAGVLRGALAFLGGPIGLAVGAATALGIALLNVQPSSTGVRLDAEATAKGYAEAAGSAALFNQSTQSSAEASAEIKEFLDGILVAAGGVTDEAKKQYEFAALSRNESNAALATGQEILANLQQQNEMARLELDYGADSVQVAEARHRAELAVLDAQLQSLDVAQSLKNEILAAAQAGYEIAAVAGRINFDSAISSAATLSAQLGVSVGLARALANAGAAKGDGGTVVFDPRDPRYDAGAAALAKTAITMTQLRKEADLAALSVGKTDVALRKVGGGGGGGGGGKGSADNAANSLSDAAKKAEALRKEMDAPLVSAIGGVADAFGDFIAGGLQDFKGFVRSIIDSFKSMLSQMIAMAIKNKIMIGVSMSESVAGGVANAAGGGGGPLGGLGGGGGLLSGLLGSFGGGGGMAGLAGGAGFLGGVGNVVGGFASGGFAGGFGAIGTALSGATTGLGGIAMAAGALALPLLAVTAAFSFFKKKTKELDSGLRVTVRGVDALVQTFSVIQTKRFWGLSKKVRTGYQNASDEVANPLIKAIGEMQGGIVGGAAMLGIASEAFDNFAHTLQVSTKGMSDADAQKAVMDAFEGMGNAFANMIPGLQALQKDGEGAMAALNRLVASLAAVNDAFDILGKSLYSASLSGADLASTMVDAFGGLDAMTQAVGAYWQGFYTEEEKLATSTRRLTEEMAGLGFALPASRDAFRALVEGIDTSTHEGAALYAGLLKLSGAFFEITTVTEASAKAISDAAGATARAISRMVEGILGNIDLMPTSRAQNAARNSLQVNETKAMQAAADGDTTAVQGYLTEARAASSSDLAYREISARVLAQLSGGLPSFAGGGYTGSGSRSGGMDGQGGFLSMMHPQEKVTDMSRGGGAGSDELLAEIKALRAENLQLGMRADTHQRSTANTLEKWDKVGTPVVPFTGAGQW